MKCRFERKEGKRKKGEGEKRAADVEGHVQGEGLLQAGGV